MREIRREIDQIEEYISDDIQPYREVFLGEIVGILLRNRGETDPHVCFQFIVEDDGHWFLSDNQTSSAWFDDYVRVLNVVVEWCKENCDPHISNGIQFGWLFRT